MKNFNELTADDVIYKVYHERTNITKETVVKVDNREIYINYNDSINRFITIDGIKNPYSRKKCNNYFLFVNESDAIRYAKSQMMKELYNKIDFAKKAINDIKDFRIKNCELLNHEWTEKQIRLLEQKLNQ